MRQLSKHLLIRLSSNAHVQRLLGRIVAVSHYLMGIGSGSSTDSSGERVLVDKLKQHATTNQSLCIFDVGANKGQFLSLMERGLQGVPHHIHAFEPSRFTFKVLYDNVNASSNVTLNNVGLGKQAGEFELFYDEAGSGLASLSKRRLGHFGIDFNYSEKVELDTLDNYCLRHAIDSIDLLKLDVEGHELDVLQGGLRMFRDRKIRMVSFEFGGCNIDSRTYLQDFFYFFREIGMNHMLRIAPSGCLVPLHEYHEAHEQFRTTNFLVLQGEA